MIRMPLRRGISVWRSKMALRDQRNQANDQGHQARENDRKARVLRFGDLTHVLHSENSLPDAR